MRVSSSSAIERASHSRQPVSQSMSQERLVEQVSHASVSHAHPASQSGSQSGSHGNASVQSTPSLSQRTRPRVESINVDQVPTGGSQNQNENAAMEVDGEVEVAEEATSEMAFQTLHQTDISSRRDSGQQETSFATQEIPLEDLSRKNRSKKKQLSRAKLTKTRLSAELKHEQTRSQSQSPRRVKLEDTVVARATERVRSSSLTETGQKDGHIVPGRRAHSDSSPLRPESKHSQGKKKKSVSTQVQTKVVLDANIKHPKADEKNHLSIDIDKVANPSLSPKTLIPSQSPAVSLVPEVENAFRDKLISDSLKLVPPVEADRIRSLSDASMASVDDPASVSSSRSTSTDSQDRPTFGFKTPSQAEAELSSASVAVQQAGNKDIQATTEQLTKLAQMVQEHYKFDKEEETEFKEDSKK